MASSSLIKSLENIMRIDDGVDGDSQYIAQITWMLFLKAFDAKEMEWEFKPDYKGIVPVGYRWRDWADDKEGITGDALIKFVGELFEKLRKLDVSDGDMRKYVVRNVFEDINNYMKFHWIGSVLYPESYMRNYIPHPHQSKSPTKPMTSTNSLP